MKIAVDARELEGRRTGVGRYLHELLVAFGHLTSARQHQFLLYSSATIDLAPYRDLSVDARTAGGYGVWWEQFTLRRLMASDRPDILFAPGYTAPLLTTVPTVLVVHDVSFSSHPEWFSWREGARRRTVTRLAAQRAARVVTVSNFSKGEIEALLGVAARKVVVVPNGVTRMPVPATIPQAPSVLFVGSVFNRRNVPALIDAIGVLAARGCPATLEIVGDNRTTPRVDLAACARHASVSDRVLVRDYLAEEALTAAYARARAFAFLSDYEGFGLTPLEALSAGVPIVVLDRPTTREVYGDAAIYVNDPIPSAIADALQQALLDEAERSRVLKAAAAVLAHHSWSRSAALLLDVFDDVAHSGSSA